jgi:hypothetical protein
MPGMLVMWSLDEDPVMPLRLTEDVSDGHQYVHNPVWSGVRYDREHNDHEIDPEWCWPDPDDPATVGCLLALLLPPPNLGHITQVLPPMRASRTWTVLVDTQWGRHTAQAATLGRACIAAAEALGRWPGGATK